ncbi:MAG: alkyl hydroperoxide reductase/Thiol specific antioxidant/Mal [Gallionellaceae bacterium]|nr:MAG: alkyl hydroperoxide reductase/Thiol specific antioxidant/Mal [Gallionellaceae bacterium]
MKTCRWLLLVCLSLFAVTALGKDFTFKDLQGNTLRLADYRGKWVVVNFWATWCPPCEQETPDLVALHNERKSSDLVVVGVALDSTRASVVDFAAKHKISYPLVIGSYTLAEAQVGPVSALPTSYLYDPTGKLVSYQEGMVSRSDIETYIFLKNKNKAEVK